MTLYYSEYGLRYIYLRDVSGDGASCTRRGPRISEVPVDTRSVSADSFRSEDRTTSRETEFYKLLKYPTVWGNV